jgi:hypothetical protein
MDHKSSDLPNKLNDIGISLPNRYSLTVDLKNLEEAIANYQQAVTSPIEIHLICQVDLKTSALV